MSVGLSRGSQRQKDYMLYGFIYMKCKNGQNSSTLVEVRIMVSLGGDVTPEGSRQGSSVAVNDLSSSGYMGFLKQSSSL